MLAPNLSLEEFLRYKCIDEEIIKKFYEVIDNLKDELERTEYSIKNFDDREYDLEQEISQLEETIRELEAKIEELEKDDA